MLFLLSPAKALNFDAPAADQLSTPPVPHTQPLFTAQSAELIALLRAKSQAEISELMHLSEALSALNVARYQAWSSTFTAQNAKQAVLAFNGDVYGGLNAATLPTDALAWTQDHLCILSGLYGVLRPLDWMQPYRLEMGTRLANPQGPTLYKYWGCHIADYLNQRLRADATPVVVNLASQEYFKAVDRKALKAEVVECVFEELRSNGQYKIISFMAKRARGLMARFAAEHRLNLPQQLQGFNLEGYGFAAAVSTPDRLVFRRSGAAHA